MLGTAANLVTGWELGHQPRCSLVLQPASVPDAIADAAAVDLQGISFADAVLHCASSSATLRWRWRAEWVRRWRR